MCKYTAYVFTCRPTCMHVHVHVCPCMCVYYVNMYIIMHAHLY